MFVFVHMTSGYRALSLTHTHTHTHARMYHSVLCVDRTKVKFSENWRRELSKLLLGEERAEEGSVCGGP